jgi:lysophospholipase L1-like esterase
VSTLFIRNKGRLVLAATSLFMLAPGKAPRSWTECSAAESSDRGIPEYRQVPAELCRPRGGLGNVLGKLRAGQEVRVAYLGGSITAQNGWRPKTLAWFGSTFPKAKVVEINAAIGGTGSDLGAFRLAHDVLAHKPDLVFVEFAVNDGGADPHAIWRGMEGIVRQTWRADPTTDICFVYTFAVGAEKDLDRGLCTRSMSADELLADHYGIPSINMAMRIAELARQGKLQFDTRNGKPSPTDKGVILFSNDGVHPLDAGHEVYLDVIAAAITKMSENAHTGPHALKPPFVRDNWERARMVPLKRSMLSSGWRKLNPKTDGLARTFQQRMPEIWEATKPGESISFRFKGTVARLYDLLGPDGGQAVCTVDGVASPPRPRFDHYCTYHRIATLPVAEGLEDTIHTVRVEIHPEQPDRRSVTDREKNKKGFNPSKYEGTRLRVAAILVVGDVVE